MSETTTTIGTTTYLLSPDEIRRLKRAARVVHMDWRYFAARPVQAREVIARIEAGNLEPMS